MESQELAPGSTIRGKYRIVRTLGRGGMGVVYLAEHLFLGGRAALKFLSPELSRERHFIQRFRNEARAGFQLRHPNIVEVMDLDQAEDGSLFIAMEYVDGISLRGLMEAESDPHFQREARQPIETSLRIARGIASGLAAAHARGIVHRDIKPENILFVQTASGDVPKIADFGIASMLEGVTLRTGTRGLMLTPEYASPEQWRGMASGEIDGRADLYALGGVLYEMLTGRSAFHASTVEGWMFQHLQQSPRPPSELRPEIGNYPGLEELMLRLLAREREDRPDSAEEFLRELSAVEDRTAKAPRRRTIVEPAPEPPPEVPVRPLPVDKEAGRAVAVQPQPERVIPPGPAIRSVTVRDDVPAPPESARARKPLPIVVAAVPGENLGRTYLAGRVLLAISFLIMGIASPNPNDTFHAAIGLALLGSAIGLFLPSKIRIPAALLGVAALIVNAAVSLSFNPRRLFPFFLEGIALAAVLLAVVGLEHRRAPNRWFAVGRIVFALAVLGETVFLIFNSEQAHQVIPTDPVYFTGPDMVIEGMQWSSLLAYAAIAVFVLAMGSILFRRLAHKGAIWLAGASLLFVPLVALYRFDDFCGRSSVFLALLLAWLLQLGLTGGALVLATGLRPISSIETASKSKPRIFLRKHAKDIAIAAGLFVVLHGLLPLFFYHSNSVKDSDWADITRDFYSLYAPGVSGEIRQAARNGRACAAGDPGGCTGFGWFYQSIGWNGGRANAMFSKAAGMLEPRCNSGSAGACAALGQLYEHGHGVASDGARALTLYQRACAANDASGCINLASAYAGGNLVARDPDQALALYTKGCTLSPGDDCARIYDDLGDVYKNGNGVAKNLVKAAELYRKSCIAGLVAGCTDLTNAADGLTEAKNVKHDFVRAAGYYSTACDHGIPVACDDLGVQYDQGDGVPHSATKAAQLYQKACDGGDISGCGNLGYDYWLGDGVPQDKNKGTELLRQSCKSGSQWHCDKLKELGIQP
ncbi:MAG TPA: serine/threonine-protein kinase [Terracidiphilus sp.]|jgi:serine/threonine protein kinase/TPR repeat protein|nr:serine/threonine-protein kinase [Terracidiphilus sp.]